MLIFYGLKASEIHSEHLFGVNCPNCGKSGTLAIHILARYAHFFWIPMFSVGKTGASSCDSCEQVLKKKEMPAQVAEHYQDIKSKASVPWWHFLGLGMIGILYIIGLFRRSM